MKFNKQIILFLCVLFFSANLLASEKDITYIQILQNPNDVDLNLKYAKQQAKSGNYKQTISTLERLNMLYPDNIEINLYLLSVLVQADSPNKALSLIEDIKSKNLSKSDLETLNEIENELKEEELKLWNFSAEINTSIIQNNNVNSVSKTRLQDSFDSVIAFDTAKFDRTYSGNLGITGTRSLGEQSTMMINISGNPSFQDQETSDDFQSYGMTLGLDTLIGNQSLSPYLILSKTDNKDDADSISFMYGTANYFDVGERNSFNYGYSYSDSKNDHNTMDTTANETNSIAHSFTFGHDFIVNKLLSTSTAIGYSDSDAKLDSNDFETYDFSFRLNFTFPWAYISIGDALSFNDYKKADTSVNSNRIRSDFTNTFDITLTKSLGEFFPRIDPDRSFFINFSYEKIISESNIKNHDYLSDSFSLSVSKTLQLNK